MLSEWDASKEIIRQQPYKGLDLKCKEVMLAEIAYSSFTENNLFFQQNEISNQIEDILIEMLTEEKRINGRDVLRAIEDQHGILVNQYEDVYSFSHLTLQEFLTAKHISDSNLSDSNLSITYIVSRYLYTIRWREVFLLLAGLKKADYLLLTMEQEIRSQMVTPKLKNLLVWLDKVINTTKGDIQAISNRAITIVNFMAITYSIAIGSNSSLILDIPHAFANAYAITNSVIINGITNLETFLDINIVLSTTNPFSKACTIANGLNYTHAIAGNSFNAIDELIEYAKLSAEANIYQGLDLQGAINNLQKLKSEVQNEDRSVRSDQICSQKLTTIWMKAFSVNLDMVNLSDAEINLVNNYLYANGLLIECERAAVRRSPEVWSKIKERMLKPI